MLGSVCVPPNLQRASRFLDRLARSNRFLLIVNCQLLIVMLASKSWLKCYKPLPEAELRLFCFPYAGSGAISFRSWPDLLPPTVEVYAIELPGRGTRMKESLYTRMEPLVEAIAPALLSKLDKPFVFFGHSMGAIVAFECCRLLRKNYGLLPSRLFVSGRNAPHVPDPDPAVHNASKAAFIEELRRFNGTPEEVLKSSALMELLLPILRADFEVLETYTYIAGPPLECAIAAFGGLEDLKTTADGLEAWREHTIDSFSLHKLSGDHFFINSAQSLLLKHITSYII